MTPAEACGETSARSRRRPLPRHATAGRWTRSGRRSASRRNAVLEPRRRAPPSGGRERKHTTEELLSPDCDCAFALERRPDPERRPAVACRRREDGPTPGRICRSAGKLTHYHLVPARNLPRKLPYFPLTFDRKGQRLL